MKLFIHADDLGASRGVTDNIFDAYDNGVLNSTSILANGKAFDYAIDEYKKRDNCRLCVHLNLVEWKPLFPKDEVDLLVDERGHFFHSFVSLWKKYLLSSRDIKQKLKLQVKKEFAAQIRKVREAIGDVGEGMCVDGHVHYHMIPFVFEAILELKEELNIKYVRLPYEKMFFVPGDKNIIRHYLSSNIVKNVLLNALSGIQRKKVEAKGLTYSNTFIGVLLTGAMTEKATEFALSNVFKKNPQLKDSHDIVEILFHPGQAKSGDEHVWQNDNRYQEHYFSPDRAFELEELKRPSFKQYIQTLINHYESVPSHRRV